MAVDGIFETVWDAGVSTEQRVVRDLLVPGDEMKASTVRAFPTSRPIVMVRSVFGTAVDMLYHVVN